MIAAGLTKTRVVFLGKSVRSAAKSTVVVTKIPEGTSYAMFDVRTIAKCCKFERCTLTRFDITRVSNTGVFLGKMCPDPRKNHGCGQKKPEGTSSAIFEIRTAAKYCKLKCSADPVRSTEPTTKMKSLKVT